MKLTLALILSLLHTHLARCVPHPVEGEDVAPYEHSQRPCDDSLTSAQSLFEDPRTMGCATSNYGCWRGYCWTKVSYIPCIPYNAAKVSSNSISATTMGLGVILPAPGDTNTCAKMTESARDNGVMGSLVRKELHAAVGSVG